MTVLNERIVLRASSREVDAASAWAASKGERLSGMIRRLLANEVPGLGAVEPEAMPTPAADLMAALLAGEDGAPGRLLAVLRGGAAEEKEAMLVALAGYFIWEYRAPLDAENLRDLIAETERLLTPEVVAADNEAGA